MDFIWDARKNKSNVEKHGLAFHDAAIVFSGPTVTFIDDRYEYKEKRYVTLGELVGRYVVIAHTPRAESTRIISMRKANARERKIFKKRLKAT